MGPLLCSPDATDVLTQRAAQGLRRISCGADACLKAGGPCRHVLHGNGHDWNLSVELAVKKMGSPKNDRLPFYLGDPPSIDACFEQGDCGLYDHPNDSDGDGGGNLPP